MPQNANTGRIISIAQWILSSLAIPSLLWAWSLSTQVKIHEHQIMNLEAQIQKLEPHAQQLTTLTVYLETLKEDIGEIKDIVRSL
jgi:hypothetical protein